MENEPNFQIPSFPKEPKEERRKVGIHIVAWDKLHVNFMASEHKKSKVVPTLLPTPSSLFTQDMNENR